MLNDQPVENTSPLVDLAGDCDVKGMLRQFGSVHMKQAINSADVQRLGSLFDKCMRIIMSPDAGCISDDDRSLIVEFIETCGNFKLIAGYAMGQPLHDIVGAFFSPAVLEAYCDYLERDELVVSLEFAFARLAHPQPVPSDSPYHQDSLAVCADPIVNTWITLDHAGDAAPGLEIVNRRVHEIYTPTERPLTNHAPVELDADSVSQVYGDNLWRPICAPGDALAFDGRTIHRTWKTKRMSKSRRSLEFRTMAAHRMPDMWRNNPFILIHRAGEVSPVFAREGVLLLPPH